METFSFGTMAFPIFIHALYCHYHRLSMQRPERLVDGQEKLIIWLVIFWILQFVSSSFFSSYLI
jgi:hypothetical protein